jgi:hypothetical protein
MSECAGRTWGLVGQSPTVVVSGQRGKFNVLSLVTNEGALEYEVTDERINSDKYIDFLAKVLEGRDRPLIVVLDPARFHNSKAVRAFEFSPTGIAQTRGRPATASTGFLAAGAMLKAAISGF